MGRADHEAAQAVALLLPLAARGHHIHGEHVVRDAAGMHQRHHLALRQNILEAKVSIAACQCIAAGARHQPANALPQAELVDGLHQGQPDERIRTRQHRQAGDFCT